MNLVENYLETYKQVYSHPGLEAIYTLKNVDVNTIRRLNDPTSITSGAQLKEVTTSPVDEIEESPQLEFDFGGEFRTWVRPLVLDEPIQVLGLSTHIEKILQSHEKAVLKDLL